MQQVAGSWRGEFRSEAWSVKVIFVLLFFLSPAAAFATLVNLGVLSFDVLIPGDVGSPGTNVFDAANLTGDPSVGGFALPPDFPVYTAVTFKNSILTLWSGGGP